MKRVAVIFNPAAGNGVLGKLEDQIKEILETDFSDVVIYKTNQPGHGANVVKKLGSHVDLVIAAGGDGTVHELINALAPLPVRPAFAIIPGGTSNDFSREIGMLQQPIRATEQITAKQTKWIDIGQSDQHYFLNFWGIGLITQVSETVDSNSKQNIGRLAYYLKTIQSMNKVNGFQFKIETEKETIEDDAVMIIVGNGTYIGGIRALFPQGDIQDGLFDVLIIKEASVQAFLSMLQSKVGIQNQNMEEIIPLQENRIKIQTTPNQKIDCDGERKSDTPSTIKVLPKHIQMIIGQ
ncbi:Putative lipid kinase BmrU [Paraliobacillus sp. PM-2]|uniref:diacylglycerol/lipid kinase family protein n=1 Tax=Paraliobacillus sp. PM-2 TaxID=1462524 RepID=UPI00061C0E4A|nr:diacylglycerol kinase family protein [Paraliobacillus sp. PM-2]CQR46463.1 Putative lipid kinase BmrU [Paraliobacillus sp. PM-2]